MIFFSIIYHENKAILYNYWLQRYFNFEEIFIRISSMLKELLLHNPLIDYNEAIKILKRDNSQTLKCFNYDDLRRYISTKMIKKEKNYLDPESNNNNTNKLINTSFFPDYEEEKQFNDQ